MNLQIQDLLKEVSSLQHDDIDYLAGLDLLNILEVTNGKEEGNKDNINYAQYHRRPPNCHCVRDGCHWCSGVDI